MKFKSNANGYYSLKNIRSQRDAPLGGREWANGTEQNACSTGESEVEKGSKADLHFSAAAEKTGKGLKAAP